MIAAPVRQALEPALLNLFDHAAMLEETGDADTLPPYRQQVTTLRDLAHQHHVKGLAYVGMLLDDGLARLAAQHRALTDDERAALGGWPALVMAELLEAPPEDHHAWAVLHSMRRHPWFPELPDYFWHVIEDRLCEDARALGGDATGPGSAAPGASGLHEDALDQAVHDEPAAAPPAAALHDAAPIDADAVFSSLPSLDLDLDFLDLDFGAGPPAAANGSTQHADVLLESDWPILDTDFPEAAQAVAAVRAHGTLVDAVRGDEILGDEAPGQASAGAPQPTPPLHATAQPHQVSLEELSALSEAVGALHADGAALLDEAQAGAGDDAPFESYAEQLSHLVNAATVVGLGGFQQMLELILTNTLAMSLSGRPLSDAQRELLMTWPPAAMAYLAAPQEAEPAQALAALAIDPAWPQPADPQEAASWLLAMGQARVVQARAAAVARATVATPQDVDLSVPRDIESNVLDSLLLEMPQHAHEFSALVQRLAGGGTLQHLEDARRVAHTLKGAGNTVGIRGVANLTHVLEDILVACGRARRLPTAELAEVLVEAADCLEAMSESLLAGEAAPPEALGVHQKVLDWANHIDREGLPEGPVGLRHVVAVPAADALPDAEADGADAAAALPADEADPMLRVPASLIDTLLKLAGENAILSSQLQDRVARLGHDLTALRGGAQQFSKLSYELEQLVDVRGGAMLSGKRGDFDALEMDQYNELHMLSRRIVESDADGRELARSFEREVNGLRDLLAEKDRVQLEIQRKILRTRMVEVSSIAPRLRRTVRQAARVLERPVQLEIAGENTLVDGQLLQRILDPLMHMLRNAVDHGIEPPHEREAAGKPAAGTIRLRVAAEGSHLNLRCEDDGRGLDLAAIRAKAVRAGLVEAGAALSDEQAMRLILLPGFSTREQATQMSGRGVGLDIVHRAVMDLRGTLEIHSEPGQGVRFDMVFPVQLSATQVMISRSARQVLALSVRGVDQLLPVDENLEQHADGRMSYLLQGEALPALRLETLLGLSPRAFAQPGAIEVVMIVRDHNRRRHALVVPELRDSRNVVVKPFNPIVPHRLGVDGATILGDGSVAMVLDLPDLLRAEAAGASAAAALQPAEQPLPVPRCLIVDDSVSVRQAMEQLMQDTGYEVSTARDGLDALGAVQRHRPDIVLVDLEMPRMNGLEFTSALRNQPATHGIPVVMITSRFTDKHRRLALEAGVSAFLTKPYSEDQLLSTMEGLLAGPVAVHA